MWKLLIMDSSSHLESDLLLSVMSLLEMMSILSRAFSEMAVLSLLWLRLSAQQLTPLSVNTNWDRNLGLAS